MKLRLETSEEGEKLHLSPLSPLSNIKLQREAQNRWHSAFLWYFLFRSVHLFFTTLSFIYDTILLPANIRSARMWWPRIKKGNLYKDWYINNGEGTLEGVMKWSDTILSHRIIKWPQLFSFSNQLMFTSVLTANW